MATKILVTLDTKDAAQLMNKRSYTTKEGQAVEVKELKFELIEMKADSQKVVWENDKVQLVKTHFAVKPQTKEERESGAPTLYVGEGVTTVYKAEGQSAPAQTASFQPAQTTSVIEDNDLPF